MLKHIQCKLHLEVGFPSSRKLRFNEVNLVQHQDQSFPKAHLEQESCLKELHKQLSAFYKVVSTLCVQSSDVGNTELCANLAYYGTLCADREFQSP